jgi:organic radical activating enzyme
MKHYMVNEIFYSLQGEGMRAGTPNVFVRFSGCNLTCSRDGEAGFDCDTEFTSGRKMAAPQLHQEMCEAMKRVDVGKRTVWCILTGGEPALQVDPSLVAFLHEAGWAIAIETNGTRVLPPGIDWISCSPKSAEHTLRLERADELRYVRHAGQGIPRPSIEAANLLLSPAFETIEGPNGEPLHRPLKGALEWCIGLVKENPRWRLSVQQHKTWHIR